MTIMMITVTTTIMMTTTETLAAITAGVFGELGVGEGENELMEGWTQTGPLMSLILTGQSESNVTVITPVVIVAPCLTQSSI